VWKPFADEGPGSPVLLAQCTVERYWRRKTRDISLTLWHSWINFPGPVQKALVIPFAVDSGRWWWRDRNKLAGMIVDWMRLCGYLAEYMTDQLAALTTQETTHWMDNQRATLVE
jgi:hypothetical protein